MYTACKLCPSMFRIVSENGQWPVVISDSVIDCHTLCRSESESEEGSSGTEDDHDVTSTVPDDLATPLPPELEHETTKSWLYRRSRTPSPIREERKKNKEKG